MNELTPEHPTKVGIPRQIPDPSHIEGAELLANEARPRLRSRGFDDDEILEWAEAYIDRERTGDVDSFLRWIEEREDDARPRNA